MVKVLFITDERPHAHCYGVDFLIQGAHALLGESNVYEFPEKPNLHMRIGERRDECQIDSDAWLPLRDNYLAVSDMALNGDFDLVILTTAHGVTAPWQIICQSMPDGTPIVGLNYGDGSVDTRKELAKVIGSDRSLSAYFQRENPPDGAHELFLSQPGSRHRVTPYPGVKTNRVFYSGSSHWPGECPRRSAVESVYEATLPHERYLYLGSEGHRHIPPEIYREHLYHSTVSFVWNSGPEFPVWDSNRFWESIALGCALVCEKPLHRVPDVEGVTWCEKPEDVGAAVRWLLDHPEEAAEAADRAMYSALRSHTSEAVFARIVETALGVEGGME